jgi:GNAT superfamily N-acetyltransferase
MRDVRKFIDIQRYVVEKLGVEDASEIELLFRLVWPFAEEYPAEWRRRRCLSSEEIIREMLEGYCYFGIRLDRKLVAVYKAKIEGDICLGEHLSIHPDYRGRGLAKAMYEHILRFARERGCVSVRVNILPTQIASVKIVKKYGFRKIKEYEQIPGMLVHLYEKIVGRDE